MIIDVFHAFDRAPFKWGESDCCRFVAACVADVHGVDYMQNFEYEGEPGARMLLKAEGGIVQAVTNKLGDPQPADHARNGDVALVHIPHIDEHVLAFVWYDKAILKTETGIVDLPLDRVECCWPIVGAHRG